MSFWSTEKFHQRATLEKIVDHYDKGHLKHGAYELAVGSDAFITSNDRREDLKDRQQLIIHSGQFALLITEETVTVPLDAIGFISIRASIKFLGLINVSGFHIDPGFSGRLKFAVYNAGSQDIVLQRGQHIFMMWLSDMDQATEDIYDGEHKHQAGITAKDVQQLKGEIASPAALKKEIDELKTELDKKITSLEKELNIFKGIALGLFLLVLGPCFKELVAPASKPTGTNQSTVSAPAGPQRTAMPEAVIQASSSAITKTPHGLAGESEQQTLD